MVLVVVVLLVVVVAVLVVVVVVAVAVSVPSECCTYVQYDNNVVGCGLLASRLRTVWLVS